MIISSSDLNRPRIYSIERFYDLVFFGRFRDASDRKGLTRMEEQGPKLGLILYAGIFLLIGLPSLWVWSIYYLVNGIHKKTLAQPAAVLIGFLLFNITYLTAVSNFLSSYEGNPLPLSGRCILRYSFWDRFGTVAPEGLPPGKGTSLNPCL